MRPGAVCDLPPQCPFRRDFGRGRYEHLSGAISWLTFFAGFAGGAGDASANDRCLIENAQTIVELDAS